MVEFSDKYIFDLIDGIYSGKYTTDSLPSSLYFAIAKYLKKGLYEGFGGNLTDFDGKDLDLLKELRDNIYMFSAAKTYNEVRDMSDLLLDGDNVRPFNEFKTEALKIYGTYNQDWLKAEYNTAIAGATMGKQWLDIESNKGILPNLRYSTTEVACPICSELDGTVAPVDDSFWDTFYPPNHYNCMCVVLQEDSDVEVTKDKPDTSNAMDDVFKMNVGKERIVFDSEHPYFTSAPKDLGENNFGLPIPEED